jgi:uncharacterized protein
MNEQEPFYILSIDGGGFRGLFAAHILSRIEDEFQIDWKARFGLISGTSTGSIIAALLVCGVPATEIVQFYKDKGKNIFKKKLLCRAGFFGSRFKNAVLNEALEEVFKNKKLGDIDFPLIIPSTDIGNGKVHVFKSAYDKGFVRDKDVLVRDAVIASCSAPTYFDPKAVGDYMLADGGLWGNSPSLIAAIDAKRRLGQNLKKLKIFSIGTGIGHQFYPQEASIMRKICGWGFFTNWGHSKFIQMLLNLQSETANNMLGLLLERDQILRLNYNSDLPLAIDNPKQARDLSSKADSEFTHNSQIIAEFLELKPRLKG